MNVYLNPGRHARRVVGERRGDTDYRDGVAAGRRFIETLCTACIATLEHVAADGTSSVVTAGWLRASLREVDKAASRCGAPVLACRNFAPVPLGEDVEYRIPLVSNARRLAAGDRIRLTLTNDDQEPNTPAIMNFRHPSVGTGTLNTVLSSSRLVLPIPAEPSY